MAEPSGTDETSRFKLGAGELAICRYSHIDIKRCAGFGLMDLKRYTANDRVRYFRHCQDLGKRYEGRTFRTLHLTSQPEPLAVENEPLFKSVSHHSRDHSIYSVGWLEI